MDALHLLLKTEPTEVYATGVPAGAAAAGAGENKQGPAGGGSEASDLAAYDAVTLR